MITSHELQAILKDPETLKAALETRVREMALIIGAGSADHAAVIELVNMINMYIREHSARIFVESEEFRRLNREAEA